MGAMFLRGDAWGFEENGKEVSEGKGKKGIYSFGKTNRCIEALLCAQRGKD